MLALRRGRKPHFPLSLAITCLYLTFLILLPCAMLFIHFTMGWGAFFEVITSKRALESYKLSVGASLIAAIINVFIGLIVAWTLVRYDFFGKKIIDGLIDLPFALPTAVAGITLATLYGKTGWVGGLLPFKVAYTPLGVVLALTFVTFPFVIRMVQPVLEELEKEYEEAAVTLGAKPFQVFRKVILPQLIPALLSGFTLAFSRSLGEYGSVVFVAGNIPYKTEITPFLIMAKLEEYDYLGASALAIGMLFFSFFILVALNLLQRWLYRWNE